MALQAPRDQQRRDLVAKGDRRFGGSRSCDEMRKCREKCGNNRKLASDGGPRGCAAHAGAPECGVALTTGR